MYDTGGTYSVCQPAAACGDFDLYARLSRLRAEIELVESGRLAMREAEARAAMTMRDPLATADAYGWFGLFLGLFPPAAIFARLFLDGVSRAGLPWGWLVLITLMTAVCAFVGQRAGRFLGGRLGEPRAYAWPLLLLAALLLGFAWGVVTGGAGGLIFFGFGAVAGVVCAVPVAAVGFPVFALLHRQLSRDGMIEGRLLWPLAFGVSGLIAATILGW